jgi:hypothetical protein
MWCEVEREVNKHPHSTLTSPHAKTSVIMTVIDRDVVILACNKFWSRIEAVVEASGYFIK